MPEVVILDDRGVSPHLDELEHELEMSLDRDKLLCDIFDCLKRADTAELELEYLCLQHAEEQQLHNESIARAVKSIGALLFDKLHEYRLYRRGETPYVLVRTRLGGVELRRYDVYLRMLREELGHKASWSSAKVANDLMAERQRILIQAQRERIQRLYDSLGIKT